MSTYVHVMNMNISINMDNGIDTHTGNRYTDTDLDIDSEMDKDTHMDTDLIERKFVDIEYQIELFQYGNILKCQYRV
jgi:hypothetical protein